MATNSEAQGSVFDTVKLILALAVLILGIWGFYFFAQEALLYRVLGILAAVGVAVGIAATTAKGRGLISFLGSSRSEVRKIVWPTRAETMQTTLMVFIMVVILAIFLWFIDMLLGFGVKSLLAVGS
ncbi:MAG: preprotein translocase subunit SecE [Cocleimonas sp.]